MTKTELKVILKLIDLHTRTVSGYYSDSKRMDEDNINALKRDITELYGNEKDERKRKATV